MFKIPHQHPNVHLSYGPVPYPAPRFRQQNSRSTQKLSLHRKLSRTPTPLIFRATRVSISTHNSSLQIIFFSYLLLDPSLSSFSTPGSQLTRWDTSVCLLWSCHLLFTPSTAQFLGKGMPVEDNYSPLSPDYATHNFSDLNYILAPGQTLFSGEQTVSLHCHVSCRGIFIASFT